MPAEITMPKLGLTMTTGTIVRWMKSPGERIELGEPLLEISTEKINYEVESTAAGTLAKTIGNAGDEFAPGAVIGIVAADGETLSVAAQAQPVSARAPATNGARTVASPAARPAGSKMDDA